MTRPPVFGMISNLTEAHEQGVTIGVAQSAGSLARIVGPIFAAVAVFTGNPVPALCGLCALAFLTGDFRLGNSLPRNYEPAASGRSVPEPRGLSA